MEKPQKPHKIKRAIRFTALFITFLFFLVVAVSAVFLLTHPGFATLDTDKITDADVNTLLYDYKDDVVKSVFGGQNRQWAPLSDIPREVQLCFVAAEDARFYQHKGVDIYRIFGALWADIKSGSLKEGASTITQQLMKNSHLTSEKTWIRKIEEAILAIKLEQQYDKDAILEMYINYVFYGYGAYGIQAAATRYYGKDAKDLTLEEGASLVAILKSPSNYAPNVEPENNLSRRNTILSLMAEEGYISQARAEEAQAIPLNLNPIKQTDDFGWYVDAATEEARAILGIGMDELLTDGYRIYTEMDVDIQKAAEEAFANEENFPAHAADGTPVQGAMVVADSKTGGVRAMIGGRSYTVKRGLNRAITLRRNPGSSIKPILVYAPALKSGAFTAATIFDDSPTVFGNYSPQNFNQKYHGIVTMRDAVKQSLNIPAVSLMEAVGVEECKAFAQSVGIPFSEGDTGLSLALGGFSTGVSPMQMARAYTALSNDGVYHNTRLIRRIEDRFGNTLYLAGNSEGKRVLNASSSFILTNMLTDAILEGTGRQLNLDGITIAGKTGTNGYYDKGNRDAWMASYNRDYVMVTWLGFDQTDDAHYLPQNCTGGTYPATISAQVYQAIYPNGNGPEFIKPQDVQQVQLDADQLADGIIAMAQEGSTVREEYFETSSLPRLFSEMGNATISGFSVSADEETGFPHIHFQTNTPGLTYGLYRRAEGESAPQRIMEFSYSVGTTSYVDTDVTEGIAYTYHLASYATGEEDTPTFETTKILHLHTGILPAPSPSGHPPEDTTPSPTTRRGKRTFVPSHAA
ncbi:PBP1A family penicillin-binding protein [Eubacteriales bacterium OttesenSCG-928-M02]|nr:PBP1A family penicillin-binding protein [Eubacteriales bacterium OttesenSCG-928-M02]